MKTKLHPTIVLSLIALLAFQPIPVAGNANTPNGTVSGTVTIDRLGIPARGLPVYLIAYSNRVARATTTDSNGYYEFSLTDLPSDFYSLYFGQRTAECFELPLSGTSVCGRALNAGFQNIAVVTFNVSISPAFSIRGRTIAGDTGKPLPSVLVMARSAIFDSRQYTVTTDANGDFVIPLLWPDTYQLKAMSAADSSGNVYLGVYYHDKTSANSADSLSVARDVTGITLTLRATAPVTGYVRSTIDGSPIPNITVTLGLPDSDEFLRTSGTTGTDSKFSFLLPAGTFGLGVDVKSTDYAPTASLTIQNVLPVGVSNVDLFLSPAGKISGHLVYLDKSRFNLKLYDALSGEPVATSCPVFGGVSFNYVNYEYSCPNLPPGQYKLWVTAISSCAKFCPGWVDSWPQFYPAAPSFQSATLITVTAFATTAGIDITLTRQTNLPPWILVTLTNKTFLPSIQR